MRICRKRRFVPVLYNNVPGGAGHVLELMKLGRSGLEEVLRVLYVDEAHHRTCERWCLDCLLTFETSQLGHRAL
ncbi:MAG: hypothetical protein RMM17_10810 [Acidobacteriota bacterium]|nr:hypothetical protein [Blastocatellia bacterium]MDW8413162.1 hypothetical protein [Acidobacteriota bacterium]